MSAYLAVFICCLLWAISTQFYANLVNRITLVRFNLYKSLIALVCFFVAAVSIGGLHAPIETLPWIFLSGLLGVGIADLLIFHSFAKMGPARTLMLWAFEPSLIAVYSYFILHKVLPLNKVVGLLFLIFCLIFMALEKKKAGELTIRIVIIAFIGINIEALSFVFSKKAFMIAPEMSSMTVNLYRAMPAVVFLVALNYFKGLKFGIADLSAKIRLGVLSSVFMGNFLAIYLYLYAISRISHPSIVAGLASLTPFYA